MPISQSSIRSFLSAILYSLRCAMNFSLNKCINHYSMRTFVIIVMRSIVNTLTIFLFLLPGSTKNVIKMILINIFTSKREIVFVFTSSFTKSVLFFLSTSRFSFPFSGQIYECSHHKLFWRSSFLTIVHDERFSISAEKSCWSLSRKN